MLPPHLVSTLISPYRKRFFVITRTASIAQRGIVASVKMTPLEATARYSRTVFFVMLTTTKMSSCYQVPASRSLLPIISLERLSLGANGNNRASFRPPSKNSSWPGFKPSPKMLFKLSALATW